jgi:hypothetical protein
LVSAALRVSSTTTQSHNEASDPLDEEEVKIGLQKILRLCILALGAHRGWGDRSISWGLSRLEICASILLLDCGRLGCINLDRLVERIAFLCVQT